MACVVVFGGGTSAWMTAAMLRKRLPDVDVEVVEPRGLEPETHAEETLSDVRWGLLELFGVGESQLMKLSGGAPSLGTRFLWGPRPFFDYTVTPQLSARYEGFSRESGYYVGRGEFRAGPVSELMSAGKFLLRRPDGMLAPAADWRILVDLPRLREALMGLSQVLGVRRREAVAEVIVENDRVKGVRLFDGRIITADLYLDASGPSAQLLKAVGGATENLSSNPHCDRMLVGTWQRGQSAMRPYSTMETFPAGWGWRIDLPSGSQVGHAFNSDFSSEESALGEMNARWPEVREVDIRAIGPTQLRCSWIGNVVAVGDAAVSLPGLLPTRLSLAMMHAKLLGEALATWGTDVAATVVRHFGRQAERAARTASGLFAVLMKYNTRADMPFWRWCREETDLGSAAEFVEHYQQIGPSSLYAHTLLDAIDPFGLEGYLSALVGQEVPWRNAWTPSTREQQMWAAIVAMHAQRAGSAIPWVASSSAQAPVVAGARP